jgi:hypothetical protein
VCSLAMSCPTIRNPRMYWQPMSLDTEALLASVSAAHLYTMPGTRSVHTALDLDEGFETSVCPRETIQKMGTLPAKAGTLSLSWRLGDPPEVVSR